MALTRQNLQQLFLPNFHPSFTQDGIAYNFKTIQDYTFKLPTSLHFMAASSNIEYPDNLPERFIQFLGSKADGKTVRRVGYALGYSLTQGMTHPAQVGFNIPIIPCWIKMGIKTY